MKPILYFLREWQRQRRLAALYDQLNKAARAGDMRLHARLQGQFLRVEKRGR